MVQGRSSLLGERSEGFSLPFTSYTTSTKRSNNATATSKIYAENEIQKQSVRLNLLRVQSMNGIETTFQFLGIQPPVSGAMHGADKVLLSWWGSSMEPVAYMLERMAAHILTQLGWNGFKRLCEHWDAIRRQHLNVVMA